MPHVGSRRRWFYPDTLLIPDCRNLWQFYIHLSMWMSLSLTKVRLWQSAIQSANHMESNHSPVAPALCYWDGVEPSIMGSAGVDPAPTDFQSVASTELAYFPCCLWTFTILHPRLFCRQRFNHKNNTYPIHQNSSILSLDIINRRAWEREDSNLQCLPRGTWFTVRCNTTAVAAFPNWLHPSSVS